MSVANEIEDLRVKLNNLISVKEIITNDTELLDLSIELDKKINNYMNNEFNNKLLPCD